MTKFLIIRFSSIGILSSVWELSVEYVNGLQMWKFIGLPGKIWWGPCRWMAGLIKLGRFDKETGLAGLLKMAADLRKEHFDYIYDAHSNIRSNILKLIVSPLPFVKPYVALRSKERGKRFLLFKLGINHFDKPFRGMVSFQKH